MKRTYCAKCGTELFHGEKCPHCTFGAPSGGTVTKQGVKYDTEKTRYDLVHWPFIQEVAEVLTLGAAKYSDNNWRKVLEGPNGRGRYIAAAFRHFIAWIGGEKDDPESGKSHLAHMACCLMFLAWEKGE